MKLLKKVMILIIIALIIQSSMLLFLDKYYFEVDSKASVPKVTKKEEKSILIKASVRSNEFKVSYDGMYLSFFDANQLNIVDTVLGTIDKVKIEENSTISFYKWLPGNNKIIYAEKAGAKNGVLIKFYYYDVNNKVCEEIRGPNTNNSIYIEDSNPNSKITDIILTPISNVMYIKLTKATGQSVIYKSENMNAMKKTQIPLVLIGNTQVTPKDGILYYEDLSVKKIKNLSGKSINIPNVETPKILGSDSDNNIYVGDVESSKVKKLYWGIINGNSSNFISKELKTTTDIKNIYITLQGKIYINDGLNGRVTELNSGVETLYTGVLKCMYDKGIMSIEEGKVVKTSFKR